MISAYQPTPVDPLLVRVVVSSHLPVGDHTIKLNSYTSVASCKGSPYCVGTIPASKMKVGSNKLSFKFTSTLCVAAIDQPITWP